MKKLAAIVLLLSMAVVTMAQEAPKKYEIKSGIAKAVTEVMGQKTEVTSYFDNYGAQEVSRTKMTIPGQGEMEVATISKDGKMYMVNYKAKQVQELPAQISVNYLNLTEDVIKQYKIKEIGKEKIGERECTKYSSEISQMGQTATVTVWIYKGYPLKTVTSVAGMEIAVNVVEFSEDAYVLPQVFEVPKF